MPIINLEVNVDDQKATRAIDALAKKLQNLNNTKISPEFNSSVIQKGLDNATKNRKVKIEAEIDTAQLIADAKAAIPSIARDTKVKIDVDLVLAKQVTIATLQDQINQAKKALKDPELNKERKIELSASIVRLSSNLTEAKRQLQNYVNTGDETLSRLQRKFDQVSGGFSGIATAGSALVSAGITAGIGAVTRSVITLAGSFEKYEKILTNALQSNTLAKNAMKELQDIASTTPFTLDQITQSYIKLVNRGFKPTREQIISLGDLASTQGKNFDQLVEALLDAQTGEFERLKEFGVKASSSGDKVSFTFKGVTTTVNKTEGAIKDYILSLGKLQGVQGSMITQSTGWEGITSNLEDNITKLGVTIGSVFLPVAKDVVSTLSGIIGSVATWAEENPKVAGTIVTVVGGVSALIAVLGSISIVLPIITGGLGALGVAATGMWVALTGPIGLAIAGAAALYVAYRTNFLGIGTAIDGLADNFRVGFEVIRIVLQRVGDAVASFVKGVGGWREVAKIAFKSFLNAITFGLSGLIERYVTAEKRTGTFVSYFVNAFKGLGGINNIAKSIMDRFLSIITFGMSDALKRVTSTLSQISKVTGVNLNPFAGVISEAKRNIAIQKALPGQNDVLSNIQLQNPLAPVKVKSFNQDDLIKSISGGLPTDFGGGVGGGGGGGSTGAKGGGSKKLEDTVAKALKEQQDALEKYGKTVDDVIGKQEKSVKKITDGIADNLKKVEAIDQKLKEIENATSDKLTDRFLQVQTDIANIQKLQAEGTAPDGSQAKLESLQKELQLISSNTTEAERAEALRVAGLTTTEKILEARDREVKSLQLQKAQLEANTVSLIDQLKIQNNEYQTSLAFRDQIESALASKSIQRFKDMTSAVKVYTQALREAQSLQSAQAAESPTSIQSGDKTINITQVINNTVDGKAAIDELKRVL